MGGATHATDTFIKPSAATHTPRVYYFQSKQPARNRSHPYLIFPVLCDVLRRCRRRRRRLRRHRHSLYITHTREPRFRPLHDVSAHARKPTRRRQYTQSRAQLA